MNIYMLIALILFWIATKRSPQSTNSRWRLVKVIQLNNHPINTNIWNLTKLDVIIKNLQYNIYGTFSLILVIR